VIALSGLRPCPSIHRVVEYKAWLFETLCAQLLADRSPAKRLKAAAGLSYHEELKSAALDSRQ